uniref:Uncharacterized protein n=1 Tax=Octactis speculum TaxID=3111310 RepID=A0A7S2DH96_9STRA|mmetsp:Transcript_49050/g.66832  ORF Transcript_49050/g.66832 Transcript_49050/m.66832 type:complete len:531 (+) Transcript_49050:96-1688(+)|eukprot:CAMPEP_0185773786 /NCGR_PEP_ID=MMETSP1174-20130828/75079_1 /TAXON_ID=35687 /ORGANISM="Dictyocha speculum, Strain CCMP1381" /LENGTH=530 /DNA_ID=CAMNT_0028460625 /DNA_START=93 /DNA_END=1685 /DNA_ORIENTATION=+
MTPRMVMTSFQTSKFARLGLGQANISTGSEGAIKNFLDLTSQTRLFMTLSNYRYAFSTGIFVSLLFVLLRAIWFLVCCVTPTPAAPTSEGPIPLLTLSRWKSNNAEVGFKANFTKTYALESKKGQETPSSRGNISSATRENSISWFEVALWTVSVILLVLSFTSGTFGDTASDFDACLKFHQLGNAVKFHKKSRFRSPEDDRKAYQSPREIFQWGVHWLYLAVLAICARVSTPVVAAIIRGGGGDDVTAAALNCNWKTFSLCFIIVELGGWAMRGPVATGPTTPSLFLGLAETSPLFRGFIGLPVALIKLRKFLKLGALQTALDLPFSVLSKGVIILEGASLTRKFFARLGHTELAATRRERTLSDPMGVRKREWTTAWRFLTPQWWSTTFQGAVDKAWDTVRAMPLAPGMICCLCAAIPTAVHEVLIQNMEVCMGWVRGGQEYSFQVCRTLAVLAGEGPPLQGCQPPLGTWQRWIHPFPDLIQTFMGGSPLWWLCTLPILVFLLHKEVLSPALSIHSAKEKQQLKKKVQ